MEETHACLLSSRKICCCSNAALQYVCPMIIEQDVLCCAPLCCSSYSFLSISFYSSLLLFPLFTLLSSFQFQLIHFISPSSRLHPLLFPYTLYTCIYHVLIFISISLIEINYYTPPRCSVSGYWMIIGIEWNGRCTGQLKKRNDINKNGRVC